jgi:hypothetical protein
VAAVLLIFRFFDVIPCLRGEILILVPATLRSIGDDAFMLIVPVILLAYYLIVWMIFGRDPKIETVAPEYDPPAGISPGVARYITTGGSDGTTLAAVFAGLASQGIITIEPVVAEGNALPIQPQAPQGAPRYRIDLLDRKTAVMPEEAALLRAVLNVEFPVQPYPATGKANVGKAEPSRQITVAFNDSQGPMTSAEIAPADGPVIRSLIDAIQNSFRSNLEGHYFRHNFRFSGAGILATFAWAMVTAMFIKADSSIFITFWLLMFTSIAGLVIGAVLTSRPAHPTPAQRIKNILVPFLFFAMPGAVIYFFALPSAHGFVLALLLCVLLNNIFIVLMRAPTDQGRIALQHLAGFREFLLRVEQDRLDRVNDPQQKAEMMNRFLPYAIALNVREGWGDRMAAAFSDAIVER